MKGKLRVRSQGLPSSIARCTSHGGFSLIELLVTIVLSSIVMAAIYSVYRVQTRTLKVQENRMLAQEYGRSVLDLMVREIRNAGHAPLGCAEGPGIAVAEGQKIQFRYDANADGDCADPNEDITYDFSTTGCSAGLGNITRKDGTNAAVQLTDCNVSDATFFTYYPQNCLNNNYSAPVGAGTAACPGTPGGDAGTLASIQRVRISLNVQSKSSDADFGGQLNATMTSNVDLRNFGLPS
jgi:prepilin-type N-terminal cleavage/methylation domain-containing protein